MNNTTPKPVIRGGLIYWRGRKATITNHEAEFLSIYLADFGSFVPTRDLNAAFSGKGWKTRPAVLAGNCFMDLRPRLESIGLKVVTRGASRAIVDADGDSDPAESNPITPATVDTWTPKQIEDWRKNLGWSQVRAAAALGVPVNTVWCLENGRTLKRGNKYVVKPYLVMAMMWLSEHSK